MAAKEAVAAAATAGAAVTGSEAEGLAAAGSAAGMVVVVTAAKEAKEAKIRGS